MQVVEPFDKLSTMVDKSHVTSELKLSVMDLNANLSVFSSTEPSS